MELENMGSVPATAQEMVLVNMPLFTSRNQIGYDGNLGFKNLNMSVGLGDPLFHTLLCR